MNTLSPPKEHRVHIYALVRVPIDVTASSHHEAIQLANTRSLEALDRVLRFPAEYADEISYYLVDELDDPEYERSQWYDAADVCDGSGADRGPQSTE